MTSASSPSPERQRIRRLSDKLRLTFHAACDEADYATAERLLNTLCKHTIQPSVLPAAKDRRVPENLSGACERLANLLLWRVGPGASGNVIAETEDAAPEDNEGGGHT